MDKPEEKGKERDDQKITFRFTKMVNGSGTGRAAGEMHTPIKRQANETNEDE